MVLQGLDIGRHRLDHGPRQSCEGDGGRKRSCDFLGIELSSAVLCHLPTGFKTVRGSVQTKMPRLLAGVRRSGQFPENIDGPIPTK